MQFGPTEPVLQDLSRKAFKGPKMEKSGQRERIIVTDSARERMDKEMVALGTLMNGAPVWWQLDGSLNVSLRKKAQGGDYIGEHSDVDISVMKSELAELEDYLKERGYGLFLRSKDGNMRTFRRVGHGVFKGRKLEGTWEAPYIMAMDERGEILPGVDLARIQVSIVDTDAEGNPEERDIVYPREWLTGEAVKVNGTSVMLSHPARYLLFKVLQMRDYDDKDLEELATLRTLTKEDISTVERLVFAAAKDDEWWARNPKLTKDLDRLQKRFDLLRASVL